MGLLHGVSAMDNETTSISNMTRSQPSSTSAENQKPVVQGIGDPLRVAGQFIVVLRKSSLND